MPDESEVSPSGFGGITPERLKTF